MPYRVATILMLLIATIACQAGMPGTPRAPTDVPRGLPTPTILPASTATPALPAATATPAVTQTPPATPTRFVTPPATGQPALVPILMYHHLADLPAGSSELQLTWTVSPANFTAQVAWLAAQGFHTVSMDQLAHHLKRNQPLPSKPIVISFDDGWADGYAVALPVLKRYGFIGTFYVYTSALDHKQFLSWAQLAEMSAAGMDIQSHTLTHPALRDLSADAAAKEIAESKASIEKRLGKRVTSFSYPNGGYSTAITELVKRAGYESAVTIAAGYKQRADEIYTLHRTRISYADTLAQFTGKLP